VVGSPRAGDSLIVRPSDRLDPEAIARAGQSCTFLRWSKGAVGTPYAIVEFPQGGRKFYFRPADLAPAAEQLSLEVTA